MKNQEKLDEQPVIGTTKKVVTTLLSIPSCLLFLMLYLAAPSYVETFRGVENQLPGMTKFILQMYPVFLVWSLLSLSTVAIWFLGGYYEKQKQFFWFSIVSFIAVCISLVVFQWAMYAPVVHLGLSPGP